MQQPTKKKQVGRPLNIPTKYYLKKANRIKEVCFSYYGVNGLPISETSRIVPAKKARRAAYYFLRLHTPLAYRNISWLVSKSRPRDHCAVIHGIKRFKFESEIYDDAKNEFLELEKQISEIL